MAKGKRRAFREWESCAPGLQEGRFMRLGNTQMLHQKMRSLSGNAFMLYSYMKLEAGGNAVFEFPRSKYIGSTPYSASRMSRISAWVSACRLVLFQ